MNKSGGDDDTGTKLLQHDECQIELVRHPFLKDNGHKDTKGASDQDDEKEADSQANIVVSILTVTVHFLVAPMVTTVPEGCVSRGAFK